MGVFHKIMQVFNTSEPKILKVLEGNDIIRAYLQEFKLKESNLIALLNKDTSLLENSKTKMPPIHWNCQNSEIKSNERDN